MKGSDLSRQLKNQLESARNFMGIAIALCFVGQLVLYIVDGFYFDSFLWLGASFVGGVLWWISGRFLELPTLESLNAITIPFGAFLVCVVAAVLTSFLAWGEIDALTVVGIGLYLVAAYQANQIRSLGKSLLETS